MSIKKNKTNKKIIGAIIIIFVIISIVIIILLMNKDYYEISSRVNNIKEKNEKYKTKGSKYEVVSWLRVQGTDIDYPVIKNKLSTFDENENYPVDMESYFWSGNRNVKFANNLFVTGHNIFNLSVKPKVKSPLFKRAEELMSFIYIDFAKKNKYIQLTIDNNDYLYKIFAVSFIGESAAVILPNEDNISKENMKSYQRILKENSLYDYDIDVSENDKIITLTTCNRLFPDKTGSVIYIAGRLIRKNEKINNYGIKKNKRNYKAIEELWEDVEDEDI